MTMNVRSYTDEDFAAIVEIHKANGLPAACLPACVKRDANGNPIPAPLFFMQKVLELDGKVALASFLKLTAEAFLLVDHEIATPEARWLALQRLTAHTLSEAAKKGIEDVTCWIPPEIDRSFGDRLVALGFTRSPWQSYSVALE